MTELFLLHPFISCWITKNKSIKTSEVGGTYCVVNVVTAATPQQLSAQVGEKQRQEALFIDVIL